MPVPAVEADALSHRYGARTALDAVSFQVEPGEVFGWLGPNGGGKTTLFRLLATLLPPREGRLRLLGLDARTQAAAVRPALGVVFQAPALDRKLTVRENLLHHGHLYGLRGRDLRAGIREVLGLLGLSGREADLVEKLSGGLRRRCELAKALLPRPRLLLLDEACTGLDPAARREVWAHLQEIRDRSGATVVLTTHLMEEAERCDRVGILHLGRLVALGAPEALKAEIGGEVVSAAAAQDAQALAVEIEARLGVPARAAGGTVRLEGRGTELVPRVLEAFGTRIRSLTVARPGLEDVFFRKTGQFFQREETT